MSHLSWKMVFTILLVAAVIAPTSGCLSMTEGQKSVFDRLFPEDPDDPFVDEKARDIDRRLNNASQQMGF